MKDLPVALLALTLWSYWLGVFIRAAVSHRRYQRASGLLPRKRGEQIAWPIGVLVIAVWNAAPLMVLAKNNPVTMIPSWARGNPGIYDLRLGAAIFGVFCLLFTIQCWVKMGRSWSIAVVPNEKTDLITSGLYRYIRHPIYGLSLGMMIASVIVLPTPLVAALALVHTLFLTFKVHSEEQYLLAVHGPIYADYLVRTNRFLPLKPLFLGLRQTKK